MKGVIFNSPHDDPGRTYERPYVAPTANDGTWVQMDEAIRAWEASGASAELARDAVRLIDHALGVRTHICRRGRLWFKKANRVGGNPPL